MVRGRSILAAVQRAAFTRFAEKGDGRERKKEKKRVHAERRPHVLAGLATSFSRTAYAHASVSNVSCPTPNRVSFDRRRLSVTKLLASPFVRRSFDPHVARRGLRTVCHEKFCYCFHSSQYFLSRVVLVWVSSCTTITPFAICYSNKSSAPPKPIVECSC